MTTAGTKHSATQLGRTGGEDTLGATASYKSNGAKGDLPEQAVDVEAPRPLKGSQPPEHYI